MIFALLVPHLWLNPEHARAYVQRWRPQVIGDQVVSLTGVEEYTRAMVQLSDDRSVGMLIADPDSIDGSCAFILRHKETPTVVSCLWPNKPSAQAFRSLRAWYRYTMNADLGCHLTEEEQQLWARSDIFGC